MHWWLCSRFPLLLTNNEGEPRIIEWALALGSGIRLAGAFFVTVFRKSLGGKWEI